MYVEAPHAQPLGPSVASPRERLQAERDVAVRFVMYVRLLWTADKNEWVCRVPTYLPPPFATSLVPASRDQHGFAAPRSTASLPLDLRRGRHTGLETKGRTDLASCDAPARFPSPVVHVGAVGRSSRRGRRVLCTYSGSARHARPTHPWALHAATADADADAFTQLPPAAGDEKHTGTRFLCLPSPGEGGRSPLRRRLHAVVIGRPRSDGGWRDGMERTSFGRGEEGVWFCATWWGWDGDVPMGSTGVAGRHYCRCSRWQATLTCKGNSGWVVCWR